MVCFQGVSPVRRVCPPHRQTAHRSTESWVMSALSSAVPTFLGLAPCHPWLCSPDCCCFRHCCYRRRCCCCCFCSCSCSIILRHLLFNYHPVGCQTRGSRCHRRRRCCCRRCFCCCSCVFKSSSRFVIPCPCSHPAEMSNSGIPLSSSPSLLLFLCIQIIVEIRHSMSIFSSCMDAKFADPVVVVVIVILAVFRVVVVCSNRLRHPSSHVHILILQGCQIRRSRCCSRRCRPCCCSWRACVFESSSSLIVWCPYSHPVGMPNSGIPITNEALARAAAFPTVQSKHLSPVCSITLCCSLTSRAHSVHRYTGESCVVTKPGFRESYLGYALSWYL